MAKWENNSKKFHLLSKLNELASKARNDGDTISNYREYWSIILSLSTTIVFNLDIPSSRKISIVNAAVHIAADNNAITETDLLQAIKARESHYLRRPKVNFRLITNISLAQRCPINKIIFNDCHVTFPQQLNEKASRQRNRIMQRARHYIYGAMPSDYLSVDILTKSRSPEGAAIKALDTLDLIRGVWNLQLNRRFDRRISDGKRQPINSIVLGPIHTMHHQKYGAQIDTFWYEPTYQGPIRPHRPSGSDLHGMLDFFKSARRLLCAHSYVDIIQKCIILYVRALDSIDFENSLVRLWNIIEMLTYTRRNPYNVTINRASYLHDERDLHLEILEGFRKTRNDFIHAGISPHPAGDLMFQLKEYVETLILFHMRNRFNFKCISEAAQFLDNPPDNSAANEQIARLNMQVARLKKGISFRS